MVECDKGIQPTRTMHRRGAGEAGGTVSTLNGAEGGRKLNTTTKCSDNQGDVPPMTLSWSQDWT